MFQFFNLNQFELCRMPYDIALISYQIFIEIAFIIHVSILIEKKHHTEYFYWWPNQCWIFFFLRCSNQTLIVRNRFVCVRLIWARQINRWHKFSALYVEYDRNIDFFAHLSQLNWTIHNISLKMDIHYL